MARPTVMTPETISKLEEAFLMGCSDLEACLFANIAPSSLYVYQEKHEEFSERKAMLKENPVMKARKVILEALEDGDRLMANKVMERKDGTKVKSEVSGPGGGAQEHKWVIEVHDATGD